MSYRSIISEMCELTGISEMDVECLLNNPQHIKNAVAVLRKVMSDSEKTAEQQFHSLREVVKELPGCYQSISEYWHDFWPIFDWKNDHAAAEIQMIVDHIGFTELQTEFMVTFGIDLKKYLLEDSLNEL